MKYIRISSSIANFKDKLLKRTGLEEWRWHNFREPTYFFGLYNALDWLRFIWHRGEKQVFWCGSDILNLQRNRLWQRIIARETATHVCENEVEKIALRHMGIKAIVRPAIFDDPKKFKVTFKPSKTPHVYLCAHPNDNNAYGVNLIEGLAAVVLEITFHIYGVSGDSHDNIVYHGQVPTDQFDEEIKNYQCGLRLNDFDGFAEVTAKSILLGQYPITRINYPYIDCAEDFTALIRLLRGLKNKTKPNKAREYWVNVLDKKL